MARAGRGRREVKRDTRSATVKATLGPEGRGGLNLSGAYSGKKVTMTGDLGLRRFTSEPGATQTRSRFDPATGSFVTSRQESALDNVVLARSARFGIDYDLDKKNRLSGELSYRRISVDSDRTDDFIGPDPAASYHRFADGEIGNRGWGFNGSWRRTFGNNHELVAEVELEQGKFERLVDAVTTPGLAGAQPLFERIRNAADRRDYGFKLDYKRPLAAGPSLNIGYEFDLTRTGFDYLGARGTAPDALAPVAGLTNAFDYDQAIHAFYGTYQFELGDFEFQPGLRLEQAEIELEQVTDGVRFDSDYFRAYPTLHIGYRLTPKQRLRGSYSRRIQRPSPQDLNPYTFYIDPINLRRGNPALRPEVTDALELAWQLRDGQTFYSLTAFYRASRGGVTDVVQDLGNGVFLSTRANLATARRTGIEAIANGKLNKTLGYNLSGTFLWNEIDPRQAGLASRSGTTATVRANLTWQPSSKDYFQLNGVYSGNQLIAQGYRESGGILNLGYRRKVSERFSLVLTAANILDSAKQTVVIDTPAIRDRITQRGPGRIFLLGLTYTLGSQGRRRQEPAFDFDAGAGSVPQ